MGLFCTITIKSFFWFLALFVFLGVFNPYGYFCSSISAREFSVTICSIMLLVQSMVAFMILSVSRINSDIAIAVVLVLLTFIAFILTWAMNEFHMGSVLNLIFYYLWGIIGTLLVFFMKNKFLSLLVLSVLMIGIIIFTVGVNKIDLAKMFFLWGMFLIGAFSYDRYRSGIEGHP